jgi:hypothetical protein
MALPPIFDPIVNAPRSQKLVVGVMGAIVIAAAAYFLLLAPAQAQVSQLQNELSSLQSEITRSKAIVADLLKYRREVTELEARLNALKDRLPGEKEIPTLYRSLSDAATASGLAVSLFQPRPPAVRRGELPPARRVLRAGRQAGARRERHGDQVERSQPAAQPDPRRAGPGDVHVPSCGLGAGAEAKVRTRHMQAHRGVLMSVGFVVLLGACGSTPPAAPPKPPAASQPAAAVQAVPAEVVIAVPKYDPQGRRDPFETLEVREGSGGLTVAATRLTGIVRSNRSALALVEAPDGIGYILKPGDTLGDGRLLEIGSDSVVFVVSPKTGAPSNRVVLRLATN